MSEVRFARGVKSPWGPCDFLIRTKVSEEIYDAVIMASKGRDKSETVRDILGSHFCGHLVSASGTRHTPPPHGPTTPVSVPTVMRDHIAALAVLEGRSTDEMVAQILSEFLYGVHATSIARRQHESQRQVGAR